MGVCKMAPSVIPHIQSKSDFQQQYQDDSIQQNFSLFQVNLIHTPPCELENPVINRTTTNNNQLDNKNPLIIKQVVSLYNSSQTNKVVSNDHQCHNQLKEIEELSKSLLRNETQSDENPDKQGQSLLSPQYQQLLISNFQSKLDSSQSTERNTLRTNLVDSNCQSKPQGRVEQKVKTL